MDRTDPVADIARLGSRLALAALAPVAVVVLRLFPPLGLTGAGAPAWLAPAVAALAALAWGGAAVLALVRGLGEGSAPRIAESAAAGTLTAGMAASAVIALDGAATFPGAGLSVSAAVAAACLLASRLLPEEMRLGRGARTGGVVLVFVAAEASLAGALLAEPTAAIAPWLLVAAAALAAAATYPDAPLTPALVAGAFVALGASRAGTFDTIVAAAALAAAGSAACFARRRAAGPKADAEVAPLAPPLVPPAPPATPEITPHSAAMRVPDEFVPPPVDVDDESLRLARELRGTIEELIEARRTIELQRTELARATAVDPLTGVASRRAILERLALEAAEARRYAHPVAAVLLDIDDFHRVNHEHSFAVGDAVLRELALRLRLRMREADALGREGGDSFLAILPHTDERGATVFADAVRRRLTARPVSTADGELVISVSIGVAFIRPGMALTDEELHAAAAEALASARAAGGNRIAFDRLHGLARLEERREPPTDREAGRDTG